MFELIDLEKLVTIVEEGTISKAAEKLLISQPALSRSIQKFEEELGIVLFDRTKNKITLNDTGEFAYQGAKKLLEQANTLKDDMIEYHINHTMINVASCAPAPLWATDYAFDYKNTNNVIIDNSNELIDGLRHNKYSLIILNHYIENKDIICIPMFSEKLYLSVVPSHKFASYEYLTFKDINGESIILSSRIGFWSQLCKLNLPDSHLLYQDNEVLHELVESSTLPTFRTDVTIKRFQDQQNRIFIPINDQEATLQFYLCYKKSDKNKYHFMKDKIDKMDWLKTIR